MQEGTLQRSHFGPLHCSTSTSSSWSLMSCLRPTLRPDSNYPLMHVPLFQLPQILSSTTLKGLVFQIFSNNRKENLSFSLFPPSWNLQNHHPCLQSFNKYSLFPFCILKNTFTSISVPILSHIIREDLPDKPL